MNIVYCSNSTVESFAFTLESVYDINKTILILSCANNYTKAELDPILQKYNNNILGAIFPEIIYQGKAKTKGVLFIVLDDLFEIIQINNIQSKQNIHKILDNNTKNTNYSTAFLFADALSKKIDNLTQCLYEQYGNFINYLGAGSGNLNVNNDNGYCIMSNHGIFKDCAIIGLGKLQSNVAVRHGWKSFSQPFKVTSSQGNIIYTLDHKNAYEVYKDTIIDSYSTLEKDFKFEEICKNFPLGIVTPNSEDVIVRDPILAKENALICIGNVPQDSTIEILYGEQNSITQATQEASLSSFSDCHFKSYLTFYFAGVSRAYMNEQTLTQDLNSINEQKEYIVGALCLGEIGANSENTLHFHNRTTIVAKVETK